MKKILHIISSPKTESSHSLQLGRSIIERLQTVYPGSTVTENKLTDTAFPHLSQDQLTSIFTPEENRTAANKEALRRSDEVINQLLDADIIVIGAPMYNFGIPSSLKAWIDHIVRSGVTFRYDEKGATGMLQDKQVFLAVTSGMLYSEGPLQSLNFVTPHLKAVLGFVGITDITVVHAEGINLPHIKEAALEKALNEMTIAAAV